jgi:hypothetical protein
MSCPDCGAAPWEHHLPAPERAVVVQLLRDVTYPSGVVLRKGRYVTVEIRADSGHFAFAHPSPDGLGQQLLAILPQDARVCRRLPVSLPKMQ